VAVNALPYSEHPPMDNHGPHEEERLLAVNPNPNPNPNPHEEERLLIVTSAKAKGWVLYGARFF
jgi:hypothetical protein